MPKPKPKRQDIDLLQGTWSVTSLEMNGQATPAEILESARMVVAGNRFTSLGMGADYQGVLELDATTSPRQCTMKFDAGPEKGNTNLGIYELDGDSWRICLATHGAVRPASFDSRSGDGFALETLTRGERAPATEKSRAARPAKEPAASGGSGPVTEMEGEWTLVSATMDGKPMDQSLVQWVKRASQGNQSTVTAGPQVMLKVEFTCDLSQSPKAIDYLNLAGSNKGKTQLGIYERDGDVLKYCIAPPGGARPAEFESVPGDGRTLTVWKRA